MSDGEGHQRPRVGIVEGFYWREQHRVAGHFGAFRPEERISLLEHMPQWGYDTYVYDPKVHRHRTTFDPNEITGSDDWGSIFAAARHNGVDFIWGVAPGRSEEFLDQEAALVEKLSAVLGEGASGFALLFDDAGGAGTPSEAEQQARLARRLSDMFPGTLRVFCSSCYHGGNAAAEWIPPLLDTLLPESVGLFWTGAKVWCAKMRQEDFPALKRRAIWVWDNWMASDTSLVSRLELKPPLNRHPSMFGATGGYFLNPVFPLDRAIPVIAGAGLVARKPRDGFDVIQEKIVKA